MDAAPRPVDGLGFTARPPSTSTDEGLTSKLRRCSRDLIRFCTPSLVDGPGLDPWSVDLSISYAPAGSMLEHSHWFADAEAVVVDAQGCDRAFLVPAGSTTANLAVVRALARLGRPGTVLVDRQAHHSVIRGLAMCGVSWRPIDADRWDDAFECPRPVHPSDVARAIRATEADDPDGVAAVILVSPTYGGEVADLGAIRSIIDRWAPGAVFHVDEAWGSHLAFHPDLRPHRAARFAHVVSQSTHKAGGALQPGAVLLWNDGPLPHDVLDAAYLDVMSTGASFLITASIDHAYRRLVADGAALLGRSIDLTARLTVGLRAAVPGGRLLADEHPAGADGVVFQDPTKVTLALPPGPVTGYAVRDALFDREIVVEKATPATVTFLTTFGIDHAAVDTTVAAVAEIVAAIEGDGGPDRLAVPNPFAGAAAVPAVAPWVAQRAAQHAAVEVALDDAIGRIAVEQVEAYPPGVAVISEGFVVTAGAVENLRAIRAAGGSIVARRPDLTGLRVLATAD